MPKNEERYEDRMKNESYLRWAGKLCGKKGLSSVDELEEVYGDMPWDMYLEKKSLREDLQDLEDEDSEWENRPPKRIPPQDD